MAVTPFIEEYNSVLLALNHFRSNANTVNVVYSRLQSVQERVRDVFIWTTSLCPMEKCVYSDNHLKNNFYSVGYVLKFIEANVAIPFEPSTVSEYAVNFARPVH